MKVIIFGGSGFLGSHVADELSERGYEVVVYDRHESLYIRKNQEMIVGDILDREKVLNSVKGCDCVYSFAGVADIAEALRKPIETIETNIVGTTNIVDACRQHRVKRFVFASTLYVYSNLAPFYKSSKQACELIIEDYHRAYGQSYTVLRYGSLYGRRSNHFNYIHSVIKQAVEHGKIIRKGDGEEVRSYIHVKDAARLSVDILSEELKNQHIILTGNQEIKIKDLLSMIQEMFPEKISIEYSPESGLGHYRITPYKFEPRIAKKMVSNSYFDLGQGILDVIYEVYLNSARSSKEISYICKMLEEEHNA